MDATRFSSPKLAILISLSLLLVAASSPAYAQPNFVVNGSTGTAFSFTAPGSGNAISLAISLSDNSTPTFKATVAYPNGGTLWMYLNGSCTLNGTSVSPTAPATITVATGCSLQPNLTLGNQPATITLTATGVTTTVITVTPGSSQGTITATGSSGGNNALTLSTSVGGSTQGYVTLSTSNSSPVGFTISPPSNASWLSVSQTGGTSGSVSSGNNATLTVIANASGLSAGTYTATININYNNTSIPVLVTFSVGSTNSGSLSPSQSTVNWSFNTGGTQQVANVTISTPASTYTATVQSNITPSGVYWLYLNSNTQTNSTTVSGTGNTTLQIASNSNLLSLSTGSYTATIQLTDSNNNTAYIYVYLTVNGGSSTITASPNPISISAAYGSSTQVSATVTIYSTVAGALSASVSGTGLLGVSPTSSTIGAGGSLLLTISATANGLAQSSYAGTLTVTVGSTSQNIPINFVVGSGSSGNTTASLAPAVLQFNYQTDGTQGGSVPSQNLMVGGTSSFNITTSQSNTVGSLTWLTVSPTTGTAPQMVFVSVNPSGLTPGIYTGTITASFSNGTQQSTTVNLTVVTGSPLVYAQPGTIVINQQTGSITNYVYLYSTNGTSIPLSTTTSTSWLSLLSAPTSSQSSFGVVANTSNLPNGMNIGNVAVTYGTSTLNIPVVAYVTNGTGGSGNGNLSFSPSSVTLNAQAGTTSPVSTQMTFTISSSTPTYTTVTTSETTCTQTTWLSLNGFVAAYVYSGFNQPITVSAIPTGLPAGTCTGALLFTANGATQTVPVTFTIGGGITLSTSSMSFAYTTGGTAPAAQTFTVTNSAGTAITYTAAATVTTPSGGSWLSVSPTSGTTGTTGAISVSVNPTGLAAGTYTGTVAVTPTGGTASNISVTLTVTTATVSASPTSLTFSYQAGGSTPASQNITVTGGAFTAAASSTGSWLSVSPTSGSAAATIVASVNPSSLSAGTYNGTITVTGASGSTGTTTINVTLTVTAPLPTVTAVVNAASFASGAVSPGEIISIGGTGLGPASPAFLTLDSNGNVTTTIGGVTVTIGGFAAPLTYVSSTQINAIVPYEVAGQIAPALVVKYLGQTSNGLSLTATSAAPGIFTQSASGSGPGAILNQNYTVNGPSQPAAKGTIVQVFMTGEGKTTPTAVTGKVNNVSNPSQLPVPLIQPVSATVGGQPAQVVFAAEAPGAVSGLLQVNLVIPSTVASGPQAIVISIGTAASQAGVTVSVQ